jgi:hypothetical protein
MTAAPEDTIVQILDQKGDWTDYARTTRSAALAAVIAGILPGHTDPEPLRAVDWITKEGIAMTPKTESAAPATITPKDLAEKLSTDRKTVRRFLRKQRPDEKPGQGGRWAIPVADVAKLKKEFAAFQAAEADRKAKAAKEIEDAKAKREAEAAAAIADEQSEQAPTPERTP